jgi:hypothetical protein
LAIDYVSLISSIVKVIKAETQRPIVPQDTTEERPKFPYCTYTVTSPYLAKGTQYGGENLTEDVEVVISLTWISEESIEVLDLAQRTATAFKHQANRQTLADAGLSVVRLDGFARRDTFITIEYEKRMGFDLRVRTRHTETKAIDYFDEVQI